MSKPASPASSTLDYRAAPEDITQLRNEARSASAGCCTCTFRKEGRPFKKTGKIQQVAADRVSPNGQTDNNWNGEIFVASDGTAGTVTVFQKHKVLNKTGHTGTFPGTVALTDAALAERVASIPAAIARAWSSRYRLRITDARCGERLFVIRFVVEHVTSGEHFSIDFVNVARPDTYRSAAGHDTFRSYVLPPNDRGEGGYGMWNLADDRSATEDRGSECLEPHEFGHMFGLKDEYFDAEKNRGGCRYTFPNGSTEAAPNADHLMGSMSVKRAEPTRYGVTIAFAVIKVLTENGCNVTSCEIERA